jgi:hypothetical protein
MYRRDEDEFSGPRWLLGLEIRLQPVG